MHGSIATAVALRSLMPPNPLLTREGGGLSRPALFLSVLTTIHRNESAAFSRPFLSVQTKELKREEALEKALASFDSYFSPSSFSL